MPLSRTIRPIETGQQRVFGNAVLRANAGAVRRAAGGWIEPLEIDSGTGTVPQGSDFRFGTDPEVEDHPAHRMAHAIHAGGQLARQSFRQPQDVELPARAGQKGQPVDGVDADFH